MSVDHESWLRKQGARIIGQRTLHRASMPRFYHQVINDGKISEATFETTTEQVYQVELDERTIEKFERIESTVKQALDYANRFNSRQQVTYSGVGPNDVSDFFIQNRERHLELLKENQMYKDAWKEFQSIRALLGETPHWP